MFKITAIILLFLTVNAGAGTVHHEVVRWSDSHLKVEKAPTQKGLSFSKISISGFEKERAVGLPELPVHSWLLQGTPDKIQVELNIKSQKTLANVRPYPAQKQPCRCETKAAPFAYSRVAYQSGLAPYTLTYVGAFRGAPMTRLDVRLGSYDVKSNATTLKTEVDVAVDAPVFSLQAGNYNDYLIVATSSTADGVTDFVNWKKSQGKNVFVETVSSPTLASVSALIKKYYTEMGVDFVILVGDENTIPMHRVPTSSASQTPSDLKYFTMDGPGDTVPDMFYSRIVASTAEQVAAQLGKSVEFEQRKFQDLAGLKRVIGIASNEGSDPSDDEYILSIDKRFESQLGASVLHLKQNDTQNSRPAVLNENVNGGALWLTYVGHGSGTSWPSMAQQYSVTNVREINNKDVIKPVIIDVACQNGKLVPGNLGATFMKTQTLSNRNPFGAAAYYGGSVNISWNPPAIMAQGIVFEHLEKKFKYLGEALLAGQLYLAANWSNQSDVVDNFEWYHLQGDPGMNIEFQ